jgi:hypothetical protein
MQELDDIDFVLTLGKHGWSTGWIFVNDVPHELTITHVFGNPYFDLIQALLGLMEGKEQVSFFWYGEPGGNKIEITRLKSEQHKVRVDVNEFRDSFGDEIKEFEKIIGFEIKLRGLVTLCYLQLKKTFLLMKDREYAEDRGGFPFDEFKKFEEVAKGFIGEK